MIGKAQFAGATGLFHFARELARRGIHAAITVGNAPSVDLLAASECGRRSIAFQVKTGRNAYRAKRYGLEGYEWDVGRAVIGKYDPSFWYALVNLKETPSDIAPEIFFIPSRWVAEFVQPSWKRHMYFISSSTAHDCRERWDRVAGYLAGQVEAIEWATDWPKDKLVQWGSNQPPVHNVAPTDSEPR